MATYTREPIPIYLRQEQYEALQLLAAAQGVAFDELVRQGVDELLGQAVAASESSPAQVETAWPVGTPIEEHPLWGLVDLGNAGVSDLAAHHDRYLAEFELESNRR